MEISLGSKYESYEELISAIGEYEKSQFIQLWTSNSRTIEGAKNRGLKKVIKPELRYAEITYSCLHSGKYRSRSKGQRPNQNSYRQDCKSKIRLKASDDGQSLIVVHCQEDHNHELNEDSFACLPHQRALYEPSRKLASKMLNLRGNKRLVRNELMKTSNTKVNLKDLHNLNSSGNVSDSLLDILHQLEEKEDSVIEIIKSDDDILLGIFYQDAEMKAAYNAYPEIFFLDAIYKVNDRRMPLYVMLIEDGNGESEIVALFLVTVESAAILAQVAALFKNHNPAWEKTEVILTDKDMIGREAFQNELPNANLLICLFHALRSFRSEVTIDKRGITPSQRDFCLELIQKMAYAESEAKYMEYYNYLKEHGPKSVCEYFNEHWHNIRSQWVIVLQQKQGRTCGDRTNNRLESTNQKIMQVVKRHSKLNNMFEDLLKLAASLRTERDCSAAATQLKKPLNFQLTCPAEEEYLRILTSYAFEKVQMKFKMIDQVTVLEENAEGITVISTEGILKVMVDKCTCSFFVGMGLPCHHILRCRRIKKVDLFSSNLIAQRWTKSYYLSSRSLAVAVVNADPVSVGENVHCSTLSSKTKRILSHHQKFRAASFLATQLACLASEASRQYPQRMKVLQHLVNLWEEGFEAEVINSNNETVSLDAGTTSSEWPPYNGPIMPQLREIIL